MLKRFQSAYAVTKQSLKSIQIDFNKNEKQKNVVEYLQEEAESV